MRAHAALLGAPLVSGPTSTARPTPSSRTWTARAAAQERRMRRYAGAPPEFRAKAARTGPAADRFFSAAPTITPPRCLALSGRAAQAARLIAIARSSSDSCSSPNSGRASSSSAPSRPTRSTARNSPSSAASRSPYAGQAAAAIAANDETGWRERSWSAASQGLGYPTHGLGSPNSGPGSSARALRAGRLYWISPALRRASSVSSTVRRTVVSSELSAPPPLIASATAAMETLSGASQRV